MNDVAATIGMSDAELQAKKEQTKTFLDEYSVQICLTVTAVASVGILLAMRKNNRLAVKSIKMTTKFINDTNKEAHFMRSVITELREKGLDFTYYPGLGIFEDYKINLPEKAAKAAGNQAREIEKAREALEVLRSLRGAA